MKPHSALICDICGEDFSIKSLLYRHLANHTAADESQIKRYEEISPNFLCKICLKEFNTSLRLRIHEKIHTNDTYINSITTNNSITYPEPKARSNIIKNIIKSPISTLSNNKYTCQVCGKFFKNKIYLKKHLESHIDKSSFVCLLCNKELSSEWDLQKHEVIHSRTKNNKCDYCEKVFSIDKHLIRHQNTFHKIIIANSIPHSNDKLSDVTMFCDEITKIIKSPKKRSTQMKSSTEINETYTNNIQESLVNNNNSTDLKTNINYDQQSQYDSYPNNITNEQKMNSEGEILQNDSFKPNSYCSTCETDLNAVTKKLHDRFHRTIPETSQFFKRHKISLLNLPQPKSATMTDSSHLHPKLQLKHLFSGHSHDMGSSNKYYKKALISAKITSNRRDEMSRLANLSAIEPDLLNSIFDSSFITKEGIRPQGQDLTCLYCSAGFADPDTLKRHYFSHMASPMFQCDSCGETFPDKLRLQDHIVQHQLDTMFTCNVCAKTLPDAETLRVHELAQQHGPTLPPPHLGNSCTTNLSHFILPQLESMPTTEFNLPALPNNTTVPSFNMKIPGGPVQNSYYTLCPVCGKHFDREEKRQVHYQLYHAKRAPYFCAFCPTNASFDQKILLLKHLKRYHKDVYKVAKHRCSNCRSTFPNAQLLREHEALHEEVRKFACQICGSLFRQICNVNNHVRKCHADVRGVEYTLQRNETAQNESLLFASEVEYLASGLNAYPLELNYNNQARANRDFFLLSDDDLQENKDSKDCVKKENYFVNSQEKDDIPYQSPRNFSRDEHDEEMESITFQCTTCGLFFQNASALQNHMVAVDTSCASEDTYECPQCFFLTKDIPIFNAHFHTDFHYNRQHNLLLYDTYKQLFPVSHLTILHGNKETYDDSKSLTGLLRFRTEKSFAATINSHNNNLLQCEICDNSFSNKSNYGRHIIVHNTVKPYQCYLCGQAFVVIENLRKHYLLHFAMLKALAVSLSSSPNSPEYHCLRCDTLIKGKPKFQAHICAESKLDTKESTNETFNENQEDDTYKIVSPIRDVKSEDENFKCLDCKHCFMNKDLFLGHVCLGQSEKVPQLPMLCDYGIEAARSQILSNYMPIANNVHSNNHQSQPDYAHLEPQDPDSNALDILGAFEEQTNITTSSFNPSPYIQAALEIPDQLKFSSYLDPFTRPISSENPWEEYWPKYQTVYEGKCNLSICLAEMTFYRSVMFNIHSIVQPMIPVIHLRSCEVNRVFCCEACNRSFRERKILEEHIIALHFKNLPSHYFLCHLCGKFSRAGRSFKVHLERHFSENKFLCDQCAMAFPSKSQLKSHYQSHTTLGLIASQTSNTLIKPLLTSSSFKCNVCSKEFNNRNELNYHTYNHTGLKPYVCNVCSKSYIKRTKLLEHVKTHTGERPFKCFSCAEAFPHRKFLQEHVAMVHGNQSYKCKQCDKTYSYEPHLIRHQKMHSGHNPYTCHICDKDFYRKEKLQRHLFVHDSNTLYKCDVCHKGYSTREVLEKHICVREKGCENIVFKCPLCPRKFTFKKNLELHIAHHQPNEVRNDRKKVPKQYYCNLCPKAFVHLKKLNRHLIFHQKYPNFEGGIPIIVEEKKFKCHLCPKTFIKNFYLKKHLENHFKYSSGSGRRTKAISNTNLLTTGSGASSSTQSPSGYSFNYNLQQAAHSHLNNAYTSNFTANDLMIVDDFNKRHHWSPAHLNGLNQQSVGSSLDFHFNSSGLYFDNSNQHHLSSADNGDLNGLVQSLHHHDFTTVDPHRVNSFLNDVVSNNSLDAASKTLLSSSPSSLLANSSALPIFSSSTSTDDTTALQNMNILNSLDQNSLYTFMRIQEDGSLAAATGTCLEDNQALFKVIEQLQQQEDGNDAPSLIIIQTDN